MQYRLLHKYQNQAVQLHSLVKMRVVLEDGRSSIVESTVGRFIFNENIPQDLGFVDRSDPENAFKLEIDFLTTKKELGKIVDKCIRVHGLTDTAVVLDDIKSLGYKFSTIGALTVSVSDMTVPEEKKEILEKAQETVELITKKYRRGMMTEEETLVAQMMRENGNSVDFTA